MKKLSFVGKWSPANVADTLETQYVAWQTEMFPVLCTSCSTLLDLDAV